MVGGSVRLAVALASALALVALVPTSSVAAEPVASCPGPPDMGVTNSSMGGRYAETFSATFSGELTVAEIPIKKTPGSTGNYLVQINSVDAGGVPTNEVLAGVVVDNATVAENDTTLSATFPAGTTLSAGTTYALVLSRPGGVTFTIRNRQGEPCPANGFFASPNLTDPFAPTSPGRDMVFTVFAEPAPLDAVPPETSITKSPKSKTKKKQATFEFTATDSRAVAGFECALDGGSFATCASPYTVKVKKGRHTFSVRALDTAGNTETSPATDAWKVRKKRRR